jgi:hypothetical protein
VLPAVTGRLWKPVYCAPVVFTDGAIGYWFILIQTMPVSWQLLHPDVMPL